MNTKVLGELYDRLTARERLPLIIAAARRADDVERRRLVDSAPGVHLLVPHHHSLAMALSEAAQMHLVTVLGLAARYWQWWGLWGWHGRGRPSGAAGKPGGAASAAGARAEDDEEVRLYGMVRYQAFEFATHIDGWRQFCLERHVEPEALLDFRPGWDMVTRTEARAREHAFGPEDAAMFLWLESPPVEGADAEEGTRSEVLTVPGLAAVWHTFIERQAESALGHGGG